MLCPLLSHYHKPHGSFKLLSVSDMRPGFTKGSLHQLLQNKMKNHSLRGRVGIALVDLTGGKMDFAGWQETKSFNAASTNKILPVYALFQLRSDLRYLAQSKNFPSLEALELDAVMMWTKRSAAMRGRYSFEMKDVPNLKWLFQTSPIKPIQFTAQAKAALNNFANNKVISDTLIKKIGYTYMASVAVQAGLAYECHLNGGGMWLQTDYHPNKAGRWRIKPKRRGDPPPFAPRWVNLTALSATTFFTLLARNKLVDSTSSVEIKGVISRGGCFINVPGGLFTLGKCGWAGSEAVLKKLFPL